MDEFYKLGFWYYAMLWYHGRGGKKQKRKGGKRKRIGADKTGELSVKKITCTERSAPITLEKKTINK